jgi:hypothetical protein
MKELEAYRQWLADEATPEEVYYHRQAANAANLWRLLAARRVAARAAANTPWPK